MGKVLQLEHARHLDRARHGFSNVVPHPRARVLGGTVSGEDRFAGPRFAGQPSSGMASSPRDEAYRLRARTLILQAASLLSEVDGGERRLAWLLEDCAELLAREPVDGELLGSDLPGGEPRVS